ncbi:MAG: hypothetical protein JOS17DRAFT_802442 [Linnemannia elongata]|nr:MAG: hypothetical protein JOS17DRAFT_802442 [Linnemannia elongata]
MSPPPKKPPNRSRSPPLPDSGSYPTHIDPNEELAWAIECNFDVSPRSHPRLPPPPPRGLQGPTSTSSFTSSSPQYSSVISFDEQIVQAADFDFDISPPGLPVITITPATDSSSTSLSTSSSGDTSEAGDSDTNELVKPNATVPPSSIAVVPPGPSASEAASSNATVPPSSNTNEAASSNRIEQLSPNANGAASSNIKGTTTTAISISPVHAISSEPSKEECGFCRNARTLFLLPAHSTTPNHSQELQNPDSCQIGDNEDWRILLSNLEDKDPKDVEEYRDWLKRRMELGQEQGHGQVQRDDEPIRVEIFGTVCPFHRRLMMRILDEYAERKKRKEKEKEGSGRTPPANRASSISPTIVSSPALTTPSSPKSPHASSPPINTIAVTSITTTTSDNRPEFGFPTPFERQFNAQCKNLSWCQFWEEDDRLLSMHFRSPEGEYEIRSVGASSAYDRDEGIRIEHCSKYSSIIGITTHRFNFIEYFSLIRTINTTTFVYFNHTCYNPAKIATRLKSTQQEQPQQQEQL